MASTVAFRWVEGRDPLTVWMPAYEKWTRDLVNLAEGVMQARVEEIKAWMKASHVWKNRTKVAEQSLNAKVVREGAIILLYMYHGWNVAYARFLEKYMQGGRFSVLLPALDYWSPILLDDLRKALHK